MLLTPLPNLVAMFTYTLSPGTMQLTATAMEPSDGIAHYPRFAYHRNIGTTRPAQQR